MPAQPTRHLLDGLVVVNPRGWRCVNEVDEVDEVDLPRGKLPLPTNPGRHAWHTDVIRFTYSPMVFISFAGQTTPGRDVLAACMKHTEEPQRLATGDIRCPPHGRPIGSALPRRRRARSAQYGPKAKVVSLSSGAARSLRQE